MPSDELKDLALEVATMDSAQQRVKRELVKVRDRRDARWSEIVPLKEGYKSIKRKHREALAAFERARDSKKEN